VKYIKSSEPELVITPGDLSYERNGDCFYVITKPIASKLKVALGNHDNEEDESLKIRQEYMNYFNMTRPFYSFDHKNIHFIMMDSSLAPSKLSAQYHFVQKDLKKTANNPDINWIFVVIHKPLYTSQGKHQPEIQTAYIYHPLFDKYNVDIVFSGHNHWYERTLPLKFNFKDPINPIVVVPKQNHSNGIIQLSKNMNGKIIDTKINSTYKDHKNPIFITAGTGGHKLYNIDKSNLPGYMTTTYDDGFGFLGLNVTKNQLLGEYHGTQLNKMNDSSSHHYYTKDLFKIVK
jgi:predicted phosphodiesterase